MSNLELPDDESGVGVRPPPPPVGGGGAVEFGGLEAPPPDIETFVNAAADSTEALTSTWIRYVPLEVAVHFRVEVLAEAQPGPVGSPCHWNRYGVAPPDTEALNLIRLPVVAVEGLADRDADNAGTGSTWIVRFGDGAMSL
jgi:hypothetical protein